MSADPNTIIKARNLLRSKDYGVLSTNSVHLDGYPFGSVANYCLDRAGIPLLYFSTIAEHTKNILAEERCSLTILQGDGGNVQAEARLTIAGRMKPVEDSEGELKRYFNYFPEAEEYAKFHDFKLYTLVPNMYRYIGGFGKIFWISPEEILSSSSLSIDEEKFVIEHMNGSHQDSLRTYLKQYERTASMEPKEVHMIGIDRWSIDLRCDGKMVNIPVTREVTDVGSAREVLVEMASTAEASAQK